MATHAREALAQLKTDGVVGQDVELQVVTGNGWDPADSASGNGWENQALFGYDDRALPAMAVLGHL